MARFFYFSPEKTAPCFSFRRHGFPYGFISSGSQGIASAYKSRPHPLKLKTIQFLKKHSQHAGAKSLKNRLNFIIINISVKYFNSYLTEIFERAYPWRLWSSGGTNMDYLFDVMRPRGSKEWIPDPGPKFKPGVPRSIETTQRILAAYRKDMPAERQRIAVQFTQYRGTTAFKDWQRVNRGLEKTGKHIELALWERVWELGFATYVDSDGSGFNQGTDDDLGGTDTRHVMRIFGSIIQIVEDFTVKKRPVGVMWGTKPGARPARALIYNGIAKRLAAKNSVKIYSIPSPRSEIANTQLAWFAPGSPFTNLKKNRKS